MEALFPWGTREVDADTMPLGDEGIQRLDT